jgi:hypothetical protein
VSVTDLRYSPRQFRTESAVCSLQVAGAQTAWDTIRNAGHFGHVPRYDLVLGDGMDVSDEPGAPQLPVQPVVVALPGRQNVTAVTFDVGEWQALGGKHNVLPAQKQQVLVAGTDLAAKSEAKSQKPKGKTGEQDGVAFTEPNPAIYQSAVPYPASVARWTGTSYRRGRSGTATVFPGGKPWQSPYDSTFVQVLVYPVRYVGAEQRLEVCREVKVRVEVEGRTNSEARSQKLEARSPDAVSGQRIADSST